MLIYVLYYIKNAARKLLIYYQSLCSKFCIIKEPDISILVES